MTEAHDALIARLAALAGIAPDYRDADGQLRPLGARTRDGVLHALGYRPDQPGTVREAVAALEAAPWREALPAMLVLPPPPARPELALVVRELAASGGVSWQITQEDGVRREGRAMLADLPIRARAPDEARLRLALPLPADLPPGYHGIELSLGARVLTSRLVQPPPRAWWPDWLERGERAWGLAAAPFALWSRRSWGIGDFGDLTRLAELGGERGARLLAINPLHAPMPGEAFDPNPYRPSSRRFLNPLFLDPAALGATQDVSWPKVDAGVDYALVSRRKHAAFREFFHRQAWDAPGFAAFRAAGGAALDAFALFNVLAEHFAPRPWRDWPAALRHPDASGIAAFRRENAARIDYHAWLQWVAEGQLAPAAAAGAGLCRDLAIGVDPDGAEVWAAPERFLAGARIGAPPDAFNPEGQDWGLPPPDPRNMAVSGYAGFIDVLRANLRHAAALRVDHVMGLDRLYVIPEGTTAADGAYLRYPREDLLGILTLESHRHRCLLVGEDLGTVPEGLRERLSAAGILSTRLLLFERWPSGLFRRPGGYPRLSLAAFATHDLPSFRGWWSGADLPADAQAARQQERAWLFAALRDRGMAPEGVAATARLDPAAMARLLAAVHAFLGRGPEALVIASVGDLLAECAQINHPGAEASASWRHRYRLPIEALEQDETLRTILGALAAARAGPADMAA